MIGDNPVATAIPFPTNMPPGFEFLDNEVPFDAALHLQIEPPDSVITLAELGYTDDQIAPTATRVAASAPFRILSDKGAAIMLDTARRLRQHSRAASVRIENTVRGGCYRSRWLRDLCLDEQLTQAMSDIYGAAVSPHTMPLHLGHLNYEPDTLDKAVDKWHHDTIPLDLVMMVSDPTKLAGGQFEYFLGTRDEAADLSAAGQTPPPERVVAPHFAGPGYAIALHGNMIVHRGAPLDAPAERITMVNAYVALDTSRDDQARARDLIAVDPHDVLYTEWTRHAAWRAQTRLGQLIDELPFNQDAASAIGALEHAVADVTTAIDDMKAGHRDAIHYE